MKLSAIRSAIASDSANRVFIKKGWKPVYTAQKSAKILIIEKTPERMMSGTVL